MIERLFYTDPVSQRTVPTEAEIPFYRAQDRTLLSQNKMVDPGSIEAYIAIGGYSALAKVSGISYVMDSYREEAERIING